MKNIKINKIHAIIILVIVAGCLIYLWGSQYYYPRNYLPTTGRIQSSAGNNRGESNLYINFQTQDSRQISQIYQTFDPFISSGSTVNLHYNKYNPHQIRIKPSGLQLTVELIISLIVIPIGTYVLIRRIKKYGLLKALLTRSR